jgi:membrane-bound ClpP family serine protease
MWAGVGVVLGLMVVVAVLGFHVGPHGHLVAFGLGVAAAILLLAMAATGQAAPLLWVLFGADLAISGGLGVIAWRGLRLHDEPLASAWHVGLVGAEGVAITDLDPDGIVKVRGETWSATAMNRPVPAGSRIQVIEASGVRLGVWCEDDELSAPDRELGWRSKDPGRDARSEGAS